MPPKQAHTRLTHLHLNLLHKNSLTPQLTASRYNHLSSTLVKDRRSYDGVREREGHITYLYACTDDKSALSNLFCSSKLNGQVMDRALGFLSFPPSLSLSHPPKSFCFFPSPWLLSPFHDSLLSRLFLSYQHTIYCFQTSLRFLHLFIGPVLTFFQSFFLTAIFLFSHRHSFILLMKVLLSAKGNSTPKLKMYLLTLYVIPNS